MSHMIAAIRVRGTAGVSPDAKATLRMLRLFKSNHMVLFRDEKPMRKMAEKVKDIITFGETDHKTIVALLEKRGRAEGNRKITAEFLKGKKLAGFEELAKEIESGKHKLQEYGVEPVLRLNPPKKGYERGGVKKPYSRGGALGYRGAAINELIMRMI